MKEIIKHPIAISILTVLAVIITGCIFMKTCTHEVTYTGTVISHNTTSSRYGDISYYTVAKFNDGYIRSLEGLGYYVVKIGDKVYYTTNEINK